MPLYKKYNDATIAYEIWVIDENIDELQSLLNYDIEQKLDAFKLSKRKKEYLCSRILLNNIFNRCVNVKYDKFGKAYIKDSDWHISISHSGQFVTVARSKNKVGIDIEKISNKLDRIKHKFSSEKELSNIDISNKLFHLAIHWSAKESVYKLVGNEPLIFDTEMQIAKFIPKSKGELKLNLVCKQYDQIISVKYQKLEDYVLTFCTLQ